MKKLISTLILMLGTLCTFAQFESAPAFPGAEGHGRYTTGGRGGKVVHVTNLNDSGTGSLRAAVNNNDKKIIVFDVAGVIALKSDLVIGNNTTILGQTAPSPGITIRYFTVRPKNNTIIRFIRCRRGQEKDVNDGADAIWQREISNLILDHCSFSWSIDEVASFYDNNNFTMQWCTIGESLCNAGHGKGAHGFGGIWGGKLASFHHNLLLHLNNRAPRFNGARYNWKDYTLNRYYSTYKWENALQAENVDFRNCVIFNWNGNGCYGGPGGGQINIVNNYYKAGPSTSNKTTVTEVSMGNSTTMSGDCDQTFFGMCSRYYINGNHVTAASNPENYDWSGVKYDTGVLTLNNERYSPDPNNYYGSSVPHTIVNEKSSVKIKMDSPAPIGDVTTHTAKTAFEKVLNTAGASLHRDDVDARYAKETRSGTPTYTGSVTKKKGLIDVVSDVNGYTESTFSNGTHPAGFDTDNDGMPDAWETENGLNPNDASDALTYTLDTKKYYTNIEVYANYLVEGIVKAERADAVTTFEEYYPAIKSDIKNPEEGGDSGETGGTDPDEPNPGEGEGELQEIVLYKTNFGDWNDMSASKSVTDVTKNTEDGKNITFSLFNTAVDNDGTNAKFTADICTNGYLQTAKDDANIPYIMTSAIPNITKLNVVQAATGSNRGLTIFVKGDGDADWVEIHNQSITKAGGEELEYDINRTNCQIKFSTFTPSQNAYILSLAISGMAKVSGYVPEYTVSYYDTNGTMLSQITVKKDTPLSIPYTVSDLTIANGKTLRGWFDSSALSAVKVTEGTPITGDTRVYAKATDIEKAIVGSIYSYDLTKKYFYPEDHELFTTTGKYYNEHGYSYSANQSFSVEVAGNAQIVLSLCKYSADGKITITDADGKNVETIASGKVDSDGETTTVNYSGKATTLTFIFEKGTSYLHSVSVYNVMDFIEKNELGYYVVPSGDAAALVLAINNANAVGNAKIFLPNGTYDLGNQVLTLFSGNNISLIGQSAEGVTIMTTPLAESLGVADLFQNTSTGLYMQDLTLKNALDYYNAGAAGRAACLNDMGKNTIAKNVRLLSYQDTYYSHKDGAYFYWEGGEIHGTVDYICGGGNVYFNGITLVNESRSATTKSGECTMTAAYTASADKGYVFEGCSIKTNSSTFNFGRSWNTAKTVYLNTTILSGKLSDSRFTTAGMNSAAEGFYEYNTIDKSGNNKNTPTSNKLTFTHSTGNKTYETILTTEGAKEYSYEKFFTNSNWDPKTIATQEVVTDIVPTATYLIEKDGSFVAIANGSNITNAKYEGCTIRKANERGGFGPAKALSEISTAIESIKSASNNVPAYTLSGTQATPSSRGVLIQKGKKVIMK